MSRAPVVVAAGLTKGSWLLILLRVAAGVLIFVPAYLAAAGPAGEAAASAFFVDAGSPTPWTQFNQLFGDVIEKAFDIWWIWLLLAIFFKFFLDAAALACFTHVDRAGAQSRALRRIFSGGWAWFWSMLRIGLLSAVLLVPALVVLAIIVGPGFNITDLPADASAYNNMIVKPLIGGATFAVWARVVGALALHAKAAAVVHDRKNSFVAIGRGLKTLVSNPLQATVFYVVLTIAVTALGAFVLVSWRNADLAGGAWSTWFAVWIASLFVQAYVWHWLARSAVLIAVGRADGGVVSEPRSAPGPEPAPAAA